MWLASTVAKQSIKFTAYIPAPFSKCSGNVTSLTVRPFMILTMFVECITNIKGNGS